VQFLASRTFAAAVLCVGIFVTLASFLVPDEMLYTWYRLEPWLKDSLAVRLVSIALIAGGLFRLLTIPKQPQRD
jgi:hypothetical protein